MVPTAISASQKLLVTGEIGVDANLYTDKSVCYGPAGTAMTTLTGLTQAAHFMKALSGGVGTIDMEALPNVNGGAVVVGTGLRVKWAYFANPSTNANPITISFGAANPYVGFGAAFNITLAPGAKFGPIFTNDAGSDISGTCSDLDLAGTGVQALECEFVLG